MNYRAIKFDENPLLRPGLPIGRSRLLQWLLLLVLLLLVVRCFHLQFVQDEFLQRKGESLYKRTIETLPLRGRISDRHGNVLAMTTSVKSVWVKPNEIRALVKTQGDQYRITADQIKAVAKLLEMPEKLIRKKISENSDFVYLKRQLSPEIAKKIQDMGLPGFYTQSEFRRYYPGGAVMAHLIGFVGIDGHGQEGIELKYQKHLTGITGQRQVLRDRKGQIIEEVNEIQAEVDGQDLALSIDTTIQYFAYQRLKEAIEQSGSKSGSVIVMDSETGEVLALVNYPSFNPNNRRTFTASRLRNRAVTDMFEPGSVIKPFTIALALEKNLVSPATMIDLQPGYIMFGEKKIKDAHTSADSLTVTEIITRSSNIGTIKIAAMMSNSTIWRMLTDIGFGQPGKIELPGEASGILSRPEKWQPVDRAVISYGHGMATNLMQLATAYTVFARDDGRVVFPTTLSDQKIRLGPPAFSKNTVSSVRKILESTANFGGTGALAAAEGYRVGGKTGTALKLENGKYTHRYQVSFVGIGPMSRPRLVVAVTLDDPMRGSQYAGAIAAPVFSDVMGNALRQFGILPDAPHTISQQKPDEDVLTRRVH